MNARCTGNTLGAGNASKHGHCGRRMGVTGVTRKRPSVDVTAEAPCKHISKARWFYLWKRSAMTFWAASVGQRGFGQLGFGQGLKLAWAASFMGSAFGGSELF